MSDNANGSGATLRSDNQAQETSDQGPQAKRQRTDDAGAAAADSLRQKALALLNAQRAAQASAAEPPSEPSVPDDPGGEDFGEEEWPVEQADEGQNFDDQLAVDELNWEAASNRAFLPPGWGRCWNMGTAVLGVGIIPMKTPIGGHRGQHIPKPYQWKPSDVIAAFDEQGLRLGMVIDLTSTDKYYNYAEFTRHGVEHIKIPCRGHGQHPQPAEVNRFYWEVSRYSFMRDHALRQEVAFKARYDADVAAYEAAVQQSGAGQAAANGADGGEQGLGAVGGLKHPKSKLSKAEVKLLEDKMFAQPKVIAVHCTHGYNRTGFMLTHYLMRALPHITVAACVEGFAKARSPGIYKDDYIQALFEYHHEDRLDSGPNATLTPLMPTWKPDEGSPEHFMLTENPQDEEDNGGGDRPMKHDDNIGEPLCEDEVNMWKDEIMRQIKVAWLEGMRARGVNNGGIDQADYEQRMQKLMASSIKQFPGSQPVSLAKSNEHLIYEKRYWFTWKADGTRYMMYIQSHGTFLIDRRFQVTRVQARFPVWLREGPQAKPTLKPAHLHKGTLLDGEMVVNTRPDGSQRRVFYIYDLMVLNGKNVVMRPWKERFQMILEVVEPRDYERKLIADPKLKYPRRYHYEKELFSIRRKDFWPLHRVDSVFKNIIPALEHENDGLILQAYETEYCPDRCDELLKWKPASHNTVDFMLLRAGGRVALDEDTALQHAPSQPYFLGVLDRGAIRIAYLYSNVQASRAGPAQPRPTKTPSRIRFPPDEDPEQYVGIIIECNWDPASQTWCFMRERSKDKTSPNAISTYVAVVQSIFDCIELEGIKERFKCAYAMGGEIYSKDRKQEMLEQEKHRHVQHRGQPPQHGRPRP